MQEKKTEKDIPALSQEPPTEPPELSTRHSERKRKVDEIADSQDEEEGGEEDSEGDGDSVYENYGWKYWDLVEEDIYRNHIPDV